jgi:hypothetical protein
MLRDIKESHYWVFGEIYSVLAAFADDPNNVISRIGGGRIRVAEDQASHLHEMLRTIVENYSDADELEVIRVARKIHAMLAERSANGDLFDPTFWKNSGFIRHPDWADIRDRAREFLIR